MKFELTLHEANILDLTYMYLETYFNYNIMADEEWTNDYRR